uniref:Constitutive coactivator of peroxisome proliferator-activated receptor gamma n=1 Tax=Chrysemys picta bellii TaxID=8478 RepID=A0A8C3HEU2_CHRPI
MDRLLREFGLKRATMGIKGLQWFVANACPDACTMVNLKEMAEKHHISHPDSPPVIVVDAMGCIRHWYTPESWVCGGQWQEYLANLQDFIKAFMAVDIKLVFCFDGVVEQKKRDEWVKRRLKNNKEIARIFQFLKSYRQQPGRGMFFIPSGLATFTRFALKSLGQETICSLQEADYEVASYGLQNNCMGILGQDTDYLIYNTSPYFSINKLCLDRMVTVMYSRENLCHALGLNITDLPLFACLLGNDIVPEDILEGFWWKCVASCPPKSQSYDKRANIILAVASYISRVPCSYSSLKDLEEMLPLASDKKLLYRGVESYLLPGQQSPWLPPSVSNSQILKQETAICPDQEIFQVSHLLKLCHHPFAVNVYGHMIMSELKYIFFSEQNILFLTELLYPCLGLTSPGLPHSKTKVLCLPVKTRPQLTERLAKEQHVRAENYMVYNVLSKGEVECSNTLEDELDTELPGQALIYRPVRQHIYSVLLESGKGKGYPCIHCSVSETSSLRACRLDHNRPKQLALRITQAVAGAAGRLSSSRGQREQPQLGGSRQQSQGSWSGGRAPGAPPSQLMPWAPGLTPSPQASIRGIYSISHGKVMGHDFLFLACDLSMPFTKNTCD